MAETEVKAYHISLWVKGHFFVEDSNHPLGVSKTELKDLYIMVASSFERALAKGEELKKNFAEKANILGAIAEGTEVDLFVAHIPNYFTMSD